MQAIPLLSFLCPRGPHNGEVCAVKDIPTKETGFRMSDLEIITRTPHEEDGVLTSPKVCPELRRGIENDYKNAARR